MSPAGSDPRPDRRGRAAAAPDEPRQGPVPAVRNDQGRGLLLHPRGGRADAGPTREPADHSPALAGQHRAARLLREGGAPRDARVDGARARHLRRSGEDYSGYIDHPLLAGTPEDAAALVWFVQQGALEFHTPQWRIGRKFGLHGTPGPADRMVLDLETGPPAGLAELPRWRSSRARSLPARASPPFRWPAAPRPAHLRPASPPRPQRARPTWRDYGQARDGASRLAS